MNNEETNGLSFVVIGAMKCGTTSLYSSLREVHEIDLCHVKELNYFNNESNWEKGGEWYQRHFSMDSPIRGDVNPNYAMFPTCKVVPERLHQYAPSTKLIYLIRDPIERLRSHILHNLAKGKESRKFDEILADLEVGHDPFGYVAYGQYGMQVKQYLKFFHPESLLIVKSEELLQNNFEVMNRITNFIGLPDEIFDREKPTSKVHQTSRKRLYPRPVRAMLDNKFFRSVLGRGVKVIKKLLPGNGYDAIRRWISRDLPTVELNDLTRARIASLFEEDEIVQKYYSGDDLPT
ncbi:sulfotransferase domain-containing protein [Akkermansiaceae bacterium]|nr:sulfotransferase domain-containing protein [Akkermansiaceae bacterium]